LDLFLYERNVVEVMNFLDTVAGEGDFNTTLLISAKTLEQALNPNKKDLIEYPSGLNGLLFWKNRVIRKQNKEIKAYNKSLKAINILKKTTIPEILDLCAVVYEMEGILASKKKDSPLVSLKKSQRKSRKA